MDEPSDGPWTESAGHLGAPPPPAQTGPPPAEPAGPPPVPGDPASWAVVEHAVPAPGPEHASNRRAVYGVRSYGGDAEGYSVRDRPAARTTRWTGPLPYGLGGRTNQRSPLGTGFKLLALGVISYGVLLPISILLGALEARRAVRQTGTVLAGPARTMCIWTLIYVALSVLAAWLWVKNA